MDDKRCRVNNEFEGSAFSYSPKMDVKNCRINDEFEGSAFSYTPKMDVKNRKINNEFEGSAFSDTAKMGIKICIINDEFDCSSFSDTAAKMSIKKRRINNEFEDSAFLNRHYYSPISSPVKLEMISKAMYIPKDKKSKPRGDDDHFICEEKQTIGVADGVGGWAKRGIDGGEYARELMENSKNALDEEPKGNVNPQRVLDVAYSNTRAEGSSTACIITLNDNNWLHASNVGDSGFMLFRKNRLFYQSPKQQKYFNCPYQLGNTTDRPSSAMNIEVPVKEGDIIITATDGLFDNMDEKEIELILERNTKEGINPEELASYMANLALYNSYDRYAWTPFALASMKAGKDHIGGKEDDITVIVSHIVESNKRT